MKLTMLVDDFLYGRGRLLAEHGVSYFIEAEGQSILFDTGSTDVFLSNALQLGIDLKKLDKLVLSHGHYDHSGGLYSLLRLQNDWGGRDYSNAKEAELIACPEIFNAKVRKNKDIGLLLDREAVERCFTIKLSAKPIWLTENLVFLARIPRKFAFEKYSMGKTVVDGELQDDYLNDDSALAYKTKEGVVIITGCSHSGICNIVEYAKEVCQQDRVVSIIGGLHLKQSDQERLQKTADYIGGLNLRDLYACHCTDFVSKVALDKVAPERGAGVGLSLSFEGEVR